MSGISISWFNPTSFHPDPAELARQIEQLLAKSAARKHWPFAVKSLRANHENTGVAYALVAGHVPIHRDDASIETRDTRMFQFVLATENRPVMMTAPVASHTSAVFGGYAPPTFNQTFAMGCLELKPGMVVHLDVAATWHGITAMPTVANGEGMLEPGLPRAVIVQVEGFDRAEVGAAAELAASWIAADLAAGGAI